LYERATLLYCSIREHLRALVTRERLSFAWKTLKYLCYGWLLFFLVNLVIVLLRERFELEGCVLCIEKEVDKISVLVQT